jgi:hypothetical protein
MQIQKGSSSKTIEQETKPRSYVEAIRGPPKKEEDKKIQEEYYRDIALPRIFRSQYQQ